jgi:tetratricopeptide (TPR) repeat protein
MGADYDVQLFAHQNAQAVHLTLMLKELHSGVYIWSDGFELTLGNWFDSQRRVVRRIAMALNVYLSAERLRRFSEWPDISVGLYDRWLRCQTRVRTFNPQHWAQLGQQFAEIISAAPGFVPAYCGLADLNTIEHIAHPGIFRSREREQKALELANQAVQLDPADMHAHRCLAWANMMVAQYAQAELHIQMACELNPNDCWTLTSGALLLAFCGETQRASSLSRTALDLTLSPSRTQWAYQADIQFLNGDYAGVIEAADHAKDVLWGVAAWRTAALAHLGRNAEAAEEGQRFISRVRANWFGTEPATDEAIVDWLLHLYPIRRCNDWERLRDGLVAAGLPPGKAIYSGDNTGGKSAALVDRVFADASDGKVV